jgi:hypothetical protein
MDEYEYDLKIKRIRKISTTLIILSYFLGVFAGVTGYIYFLD